MEMYILAIVYWYTKEGQQREKLNSHVKLCSYISIDIREIKHDVYGKRQDEIFFLPKHGETWFI